MPHPDTILGHVGLIIPPAHPEIPLLGPSNSSSASLAFSPEKVSASPHFPGVPATLLPPQRSLFDCSFTISSLQSFSRPALFFFIALLITWHYVTYFFWSRLGACGILFPPPGIKPVPPAVEAESTTGLTGKSYVCVLNLFYLSVVDLQCFVNFCCTAK